MSMRLFDAAAVRAHAPMAAVIAAVRDALIRFEQGEFETPQRLSFDAGFGLVMPVYHRPTRSIAIKSLTLDAARLPLIKGTVALIQAGTADPVMADAPTVTALRTAAMVGLAADIFAAPDARLAVVFGAGAQAIEQVRALVEVRSLTDIVLVGRNFDRALQAVDLLGRELPQLRLEASTTATPFLAGADIIGCATTSCTPLFAAAALKPGAFVAAIGSYTPAMHELPQDLLGTVARVYVDHIDACLAESGEIIAAVKSGLLVNAQLVPLSRALQIPVDIPGGTTVFKSVGVAPLDWAVMQVLAAALSE